jgi:ATP-dependent exoDNAse (exonuclease V) beta subunit
VNDPKFRPWFDENAYDSAFSEVPVYYYQDEKLVQGVIDRLVVKGDSCVLIDYKTHRGATVDNLAAISAAYGEQLRFYAEGVKRLWPDKSVCAWSLFTACACAYEWREEPAAER